MKLLISLLGFMCFIYSCKSPSRVPNSFDSLNSTASDLLKRANRLIQQSRQDSINNVWQYETDTDRMTSKPFYFASIKSYGLGKSGNILIAKKFGVNHVQITIDDGQFMTGVYNGKIRARFDKSNPITFYCDKSSDDDPKILFVENAIQFIRNLKKTKHLIIESTFYQEGIQQMDFNTCNLKWDLPDRPHKKYNKYRGVDYGFHPALDGKEPPKRPGYIAISGKNRNGHDTIVYIKGYQ